MHTVVRYLTPLLAALVGILHCSATGWAIGERDAILVGRISHIEGDLMRYVEETKDWTLTVPDAPFGLEDALYSGNNAKAEMILPNETWMRIGEDTQVQMIDLNADATTVDVASGLARFYNRSRDVVIKATTPFGYVVAPAGSAFDLYVGDESLEVIAVRGEVDFVHEASGTRYPVRQGGSSIIADRRITTQGNGTVDGPWDDWNNQRESLWAQRQRSRTSSANLLPAPIREDAYVLEDTGRWERVYYDGDYRDMWRPIRVDDGWRPYTNGRWVDYYGDNCWIPSEPFGYLTHHYGSWVYVDAFRAWYWMPPAPRRPAYRTTVVISFGWYPGRVGWFHHGRDIGWVPLAPNEDYYGYRHWGHRTKVIRQQTPMINLSRYHYLNHASIIDRDYLYRGDRYPRDIRRDVNKTVIINQYKPVTQWNDFRQDKRRFDFGDRHIDRKPHVETVERIRENDRRRKEIDRFDRGRIERDLQQVKVSRDIPTRTEVRSPMTTSKLVDAEKRTAPLDRGTLPSRQFKPKERERTISTEGRPGFDTSSPGERGPEREDRFNRRPPQEETTRQQLRSPRDRQVEAPGKRELGDGNQQEMRHGPRDPQELRRSREAQQSGEGRRPSFSREQDMQGQSGKEPSGKGEEEQLRQQRPGKTETEGAATDRFGAGRRDRLNRPTGEGQSEPQQRFERPEQQNQPQEGVQRPQREFDRRQRDQQAQQQQLDQGEQRRRQAEERLQQQREQTQQQEMQQRRQQEAERNRQTEERQQDIQRERQQQMRQQRDAADDRLQQQREQAQQQEMQQRRQQEAERNRQAEERQQDMQRQQQMRRQQEEQQQQEAERGRQMEMRRQQEQQQEMQRRQQQEAERNREAEMRRQQEQQQEMQRRQQQEAERNRQMEMRRQQEQQQEMQRRQQQEAERNRQMEMRRQQEQQQEMQRRQQQEAERNRQMEMRRQQEQQQEMQRRQQQEAERNRQMEMRRQQEQQQEMQRRQQQEQQRQQQEQQRQQQEAQRKKRPLTPEEQQQLNQGR